MTAMNEAERQRELDRYRVVDALPDEAFDDIVQVAAVVCGAPTALVSIIDRGRQWFRARVGFDRPETRRDEAFCDHAIRTPEQLFEVPDATQDSRFANNPLVTGATSVRFYAGMPLVTPAGAAIGTVCVLDNVPRSLDAAQRSALSALARIAMNLIEAKNRERELERNVQLAPVATADTTPQRLARCTVAIFEVSNAGAALNRMGERTFERVLQSLHDKLESNLPPDSGDSISRVSGCAELIAVLHSPASSKPLRGLQEQIAAFEQETGLRIVSAHAESQDDNERLEQVYQRADEALTQAKDAL
ncbi:MAG TPA: GAF domain-containing protein [Rudaea sp.]